MSASLPKDRTYFTLSAYEMKLAAHRFVEARRAELGEHTNPYGYVSLEVTFCEESDRVMGGRIYYTREPVEGDDPLHRVEVKGQGKGSRNGKRR